MSRSFLPLLLALAACPPVVPGPTGSTDGTDGSDDTDGVETTFATLPQGAWSFVPVDGMICASGAATGIGVNPGSNPEKIAVMIQGGGACWDTNTCYVLKTAVQVESGFTEAQLAGAVAPLDAHPLYDRDAPDNPWADATFVFVPYCTADLHAGDAVGHYDPLKPDRELHHHGDANMAALAERLRAELPDVDRAWFVGLSAGGYGVQLQADRLVSIWPDADSALLGDGSPMVQPYGGRWGEFERAWSLRRPAGCEDCETLPDILAGQVDATDGSRLGLITTRSDGVITLYLNYPLGGLAGPVDRLAADVYAADEDLDAFVVEGDQHVLIGELGRKDTKDRVLGAWLDAWVSGEGWPPE